MKRANNTDDLLEVVPEEIIMEILLILFPDVGDTQECIEKALTIRQTSKLMKVLVDKHLFLPVKRLRESVSCLLTDRMVRLFPGIEHIIFSYMCIPGITEKGLARMKSLQSLDLDNVVFQAKAFKSLTNLKKLSLMESGSLNECLFTLSNLECLELLSEENITDEALDHLPQLKELSISGSYTRINGTAFAKMTRLEKLHLFGPFGIKRDALLPLADTLVDLALEGDFAITDETMSKMVNLKSLSLTGNGKITDKGIIGLTCLTKLELSLNIMITDNGLSQMSQLTELNLGSNARITFDALMPFRKNLKMIDIAYSMIEDVSLLSYEAFPALRLIKSCDDEDNFFSIIRAENGEETRDD